MAVTRADKVVELEQLEKAFKGSDSAILVDYKGMNVPQVTELRRQLRTAKAAYRVVKNSLARKAVSGTSFECISPVLKGPLVLAFSKDDPGAAARVVKAFSKDNDKLVPTAVAIGGQLLAPKDLDRVASLPTREQALAILMGVLKAPIQKLAATLAATPSKLVRTLAAVRDQKQAAA